MGFLSNFFGGGNGGYKAPPRPQLSGMGKWAQTKTYADIERGLAGGGLLPGRISGFGAMRTALKGAYPQAERGLESQLNRLVPREDVKVRGFAKGLLGRSYARGLHGLREEETEAKYNEQQEALAMGLSALGAEKGMATDITQLFNQQRMADLANRARFGTFGMNLGTGIGEMAGWMLPSGAQKYAQGMAGKTPLPTQALSGSYEMGY